MNQTERREIYWEMYTVAEGLRILMTAPEIRSYNCGFGSPRQVPACFCYLIKRLYESIELIDLPELEKPPLKSYVDFWYMPGDWEIRSEKLLEAIKLTYL